MSQRSPEYTEMTPWKIKSLLNKSIKNSHSDEILIIDIHVGLLKNNLFKIFVTNLQLHSNK